MKDPASDEELFQWIEEVCEWGATSLPGRLDRTLSYGDSSEQVVDIWLPDNGRARATVVSIHGGDFLGEVTREVHEPLARSLTAEGFAVANLEYRRIGSGGGIAESTSDVDAAIDAVLAVDDLSTEAVAVFGQSAGGYLALWAAAHEGVDLVLGLSPLTSLVGWKERGAEPPPMVEWAGALPDEDPQRYAAGDLARRLPTGTQTVIMHGEDDTSIPHEESERFAQLARAAGEPLEFESIPDEGHFGWLDPRLPVWARADHVLTEWLAARTESVT